MFTAQIIGGRFIRPTGIIRGTRPFAIPQRNVVVNNHVTSPNLPLGSITNNPGPSHTMAHITVGGAPMSLKEKADWLVEKAASIGINVSYDMPTAGDGNCFYHAIIECLEKKGIVREDINGNSMVLRHNVVEFVHRNRDYVTTFYDPEAEDNRDISTLINEQYFPGIHASELFVRATAMYLNIAILAVE